jgi:murein DD-endopeptidase MepM/ murein hydrolase activator NlpD
MRMGSARAVCGALVLAALLLLYGPGAAQARNGPGPEDRSKAQRAVQQAADVLETATARAQAAGVSFIAASQRLPAAQTAVANAQGLVAAAQVRAGVAERAARQAGLAFRRAEQRYAAAQRAVVDARDQLGRFVRATYEGQPYMVLSALGAGGGPEELLDRLSYATQLVGGQGHAVELVEMRRQSVAEERATVEAQKRLADAARARASAALAAAAARQVSAQAAQARVQSLVAQRQEAVRVAGEEEQESSAQYAEAQTESYRIGQALRAAARRARSGGRHSSNGHQSDADQPYLQHRSGSRSGLRMPVVGWKSSDFGYRFDPYYHRLQLHAGTDFAAPEGAPIWAAAAGVVVRAGWNGGYGNYTCIYHYDLPNGQGLSTCYGHQSKILVSIGQRVEQGQQIGRVGTTGASTGDHLHFEVRLDGTPVNPLGWL